MKIPEIKINVQSIPIAATTRKLKARWSPGLAQDMKAYHALDLETVSIYIFEMPAGVKPGDMLRFTSETRTVGAIYIGQDEMGWYDILFEGRAIKAYVLDGSTGRRGIFEVSIESAATDAAPEASDDE